MLRKLLPYKILAVLLLACGPVLAQTNIIGGGVLGDAKAGAAAFQGAGDIVSGALAWYGLRAYSAAKAGTKAINLCDNAGANCADISTSATTGRLNNPGTLGANNCATSNTCQIKTWYDQSGALSCTGGVACDATQATAANRPTLTFNCINGLPCAAFLIANSTNNRSPSMTAPPAQPYTVSAVVERVGGFTTKSLYFGGSGLSGFGFSSTANALDSYSSTDVILTGVNDSAYHSIQTVVNNPSSVYYVDGTSHAVSIGTAAFGTAGSLIFLGEDSFGGFVTANLSEVGLWASGFTGTNNSNMCHNQFGFWGTATSC